MAFKCDSKPTNDGIFRGKLFIDNQLRTPQGAEVFSGYAINTELLPLIDAGINRLNEIASAAPNNYSNLASPSAYKVYLFPRSPRCENPAFLIKANTSQNDGSIWDKDERPGKVALCAAGMVVGSESNEMLVVDDAGIMPTIVRYEGEHLALFHVHRERFEATKYHSATSYHPILGEGARANVKTWSNPTPTPTRLKSVTVKLGKNKQVCVLLSK